MNIFRKRARTGKTGRLIKWVPLRFEKRLGIVHTRVNRFTAQGNKGIKGIPKRNMAYTRRYKLSFYRAGFVENAVVDVVYEREVVGGMPVEAVTVDVEGNSLDQLVDRGNDL